MAFMVSPLEVRLQLRAKVRAGRCVLVYRWGWQIHRCSALTSAAVLVCDDRGYLETLGTRKTTPSRVSAIMVGLSPLTSQFPLPPSDRGDVSFLFFFAAGDTQFRHNDPPTCCNFPLEQTFPNPSPDLPSEYVFIRFWRQIELTAPALPLGHHVL